MDLNAKNVVYIGGSGGIGSAACRRLVQKNVANLAVLDVTENVDLIRELQTLNQTTNVFFMKIDLRRKENVQKCLNEVNSKIGHIDVLVNGSGVFNEVEAEVTIGVNLLGVIHSTMTALALMDKSKGNRGGSIVNIASVAGLDPFPHSPIYCASKAGVVLFSRALAIKEIFGQTGVSIIVICPGITRTPLLKQFTAESLTPHSTTIQKIFDGIKHQGPDDCAKNIIDLIEINKNGASYLCDVGQFKEISQPLLWDIQK